MGTRTTPDGTSGMRTAPDGADDENGGSNAETGRGRRPGGVARG